MSGFGEQLFQKAGLPLPTTQPGFRLPWQGWSVKVDDGGRRWGRNAFGDRTPQRKQASPKCLTALHDHISSHQPTPSLDPNMA